MVSAVILNYKNPDLTCSCVEKLLIAARTGGTAVEVIVVDNSAPETASTLRKRLPAEVIIIENDSNLGFSKANNQGIERAGGEIILVMNNDLFINAETLQNGVEYITTHPETGVWAPMLTDQQGNPQRSCSQFPSLTGLVTEYLMKMQYDNRMAEQAMQSDTPVEVDTVIGACMFIPAKLLDEAGGFDEDYFFNVEDVDLCLNIKKRGYQIIFDPRCSVVHLVNASQNGHWHENKYLHESRMLYFKKNHHPVKSAIAEGVIKTGIQLRKMKHKLLPG